VAVLLSVVAGGALLGLTGTILAVPVVAVVANSLRAYRSAETTTRAGSG